jgi:choline dehydrogenase
MNKVNGERMSAARCYLTAEVRRRKNLRIRARTLVRRIISQNRRVTGLEVETDGRVETLSANRVILCAGAIATPCILMRSGIGPRAKVERIGVDCVVDLPAVGARLLDHPGAAIIVVPRFGLTSVSHPLIQTMLRYTSQGSPYPNDMQLQPGSFFALPQMPLPLASIMCCVGKPKGFGTLRLKTADPSSLHGSACAPPP